MSPRKVNKEERRKEIALKCADLIHDIGMKKLTVSQVAKTANIGKGTVYEYFENKDDIVFEIINIHIQRYMDEFDELVSKASCIKQKLEVFFRFVLDDSEDSKKHLNGYKEFLSIVLAEENIEMKEFNCEKNALFREKLYSILKEAVDKKELKAEVLVLTDGILTYQKGLALRKMVQAEFDEKEDFNKFIDAVLTLNRIDK